MHITIVAVGQKLPAWAQTAVDDYLARFPRDFTVIVKEVKAEARTGGKPVAQVMAAEAERIGHAYAAAIICGLNSLKPAEPEFSCRSSAFEMPGREIFPDELAEANAVMEKYADLEFSQETARNLTAEDLNKLIAVFDPKAEKQLCMFTAKGVKSNPVIWSSSLFDKADIVPENANVRPVFMEHADYTSTVELKGKNKLLDVNYPSDLEQVALKRKDEA